MNSQVDFYQWINDNNPPDELEYRKGWWDYVEIIQRMMQKINVENAEVIGTYLMRTPPPKEELLMPVVKLQIRGTTFIMKYDFGVWPERWTISVKKNAKFAGPTFGLFDEREDIRKKDVSGFIPEWVYPQYSVSPAEFSCELRDEWDVYAFITLLSYDG